MLVIVPKAIRGSPLKTSQPLSTRNAKCITNETYYFLLKQRQISQSKFHVVVAFSSLSLLIFSLSAVSLLCVACWECTLEFPLYVVVVDFCPLDEKASFFPLCVWLCLSCLVFCGEFVPPSGHDDCDAGAFFKWKVVNFMRTLFDRKMWQLTAKEIRNKGGRGWTTNSDSDKNWHKQKFSSAVKPVYNVTNNFSLYFFYLFDGIYCSAAWTLKRNTTRGRK